MFKHQSMEVFNHLKTCFPFAPVLHHPVPIGHFLWRSMLPWLGLVKFSLSSQKRINPFHVFSNKLSPAENNLIGDGELIAVKLGLEEWRHLLESATFAVIIFTDHKNLECLLSACRLNPQQASRDLFLSQFNSIFRYPQHIVEGADCLRNRGACSPPNYLGSSWADQDFKSCRRRSAVCPRNPGHMP